MLFNSYEFIFLLLPIALAGDAVFRRHYSARILWLLVCSLFFYAWWNPVYLPLLLATIGFNYWLGAQLRLRSTKWFLWFGVAVNLALLGYYKYAEFFLDKVSWLTGAELNIGHIALPLAISFFTFTQIAYLFDCYAGRSPDYDLAEYSFFVSFFPHLIAGPIVHHVEMMPQVRADNRPEATGDLVVGITIFTLGLFKKAVLADGIAPFARALFDDPTAWKEVTLVHAWIGVLAYGFQLYFDFSGYSDMAIGAARMFGVKLPLNFFSPYRAETISDFWQRWHMTLSRFLRDYLYIPLGGNRNGNLSRYRNLMLTMLLGGLWHGAGFTFVLWGILHGAFLVIQHSWSFSTKGIERWKKTLLYRFAACAITFIAVHFAWVYFRSNSLESAHGITLAMLGQNGISIPASVSLEFGFLNDAFAAIGIQKDTTSGTEFIQAIAWIGVLAVVIWGFPTTQTFMQDHEPAWEYTECGKPKRLPSQGFGAVIPFAWKPSTLWSLVIGALSVCGILSLAQVSEFLYFQF